MLHLRLVMVSKVGPCSEVSFKSPLGACTWAQGTAREDAGFPLELQASSRPPASRGRNAQDQLSAGPRPPFRGAPRTGPSSTAELTGSVCPTGRAAPTKNSSPAQGGLLPPGPAPPPWESEPGRHEEPWGAPARQGPTPRGPGRVRSAGATGAAEGGRSDAGRDGRWALGRPSARLGLPAAAGASRGRALRGHALQPR